MARASARSWSSRGPPVWWSGCSRAYGVGGRMGVCVGTTSTTTAATATLTCKASTGGAASARRSRATTTTTTNSIITTTNSITTTTTARVARRESGICSEISVSPRPRGVRMARAAARASRAKKLSSRSSAQRGGGRRATGRGGGRGCRAARASLNPPDPSAMPKWRVGRIVGRVFHGA